MQLVVERVMVAMVTHPHEHHVTLWASKVFAHAANNGTIEGRFIQRNIIIIYLLGIFI